MKSADKGKEGTVKLDKFDFEDIEGEILYLDPLEMEDYEGVPVKLLPDEGRYRAFYRRNLKKLGKVLPEGEVLVAAEVEGKLKVIMVRSEYLQWRRGGEDVDDQAIRDGIFEEFVEGMGEL